jgi:type IV secretory pathway VirD2 relaxase
MRDSEFKPKLGKPQSGRGLQTKRVTRLVAKATARRGKPKSPWANALTKRPVAELARGKGALYGLNPPPPGWRRVVVKVRIARHGTTNLAAARAHQHYLVRDGVTRDGGPGTLYDREHDIVDGGLFLEAQKGDTYQFRMIVAPEDGGRMADLKPFVRDLMAQMEDDLGTKLDWVAVDHFNTGHPHTHVILAGHDHRGDDLVMARDYISHGIRTRARDLVTLGLGPEHSFERIMKLANEMRAERFTSIDRGILGEAEQNILAVTARTDGDHHRGTLRVGRLRHLQQMGLAEERQTGVWQLDAGLETKLRALGERGDIMVIMTRAMKAADRDVAAGDFAIFSGASKAAPVIGRVVETGIADEMTDRKYLVVDGIDGRVHYAETSKLDAHNSPDPGMIIALSGGGGRAKMRNAQVEILSHWPVEKLPDLEATTWLDQIIVAAKRPAIHEKGFGAEVSKAISSREVWLIANEYAIAGQPGTITPNRGMIQTLHQESLDRVVDHVSAKLNLPHLVLSEGSRFQGRHVNTVQLPEMKIAVIRGRQDFALIPYQSALMQMRGREMVVRVQDRAVSLVLFDGRDRGLGLSR